MILWFFKPESFGDVEGGFPFTKITTIFPVTVPGGRELVTMKFATRNRYDLRCLEPFWSQNGVGFDDQKDFMVKNATTIFFVGFCLVYPPWN